MALIDKLIAIGNAIREKNGTTELIPLVDMPSAILDIVSEPKLLDNTVTFMVEGNPYEIVSVKNGNSVNAPINTPTVPSGNLSAWLDTEGNEITFPYTPNSNTELTALFQHVRKEMEVSEAGTVLFSIDGVDYTKTNDGTAILGQAYCVINGKTYVSVMLISKDHNATVANKSDRTESVTYDGEKWYCNFSFTNEHTYPITTGIPPYECGETTAVYKEQVIDVLDTYFIKN